MVHHKNKKQKRCGNEERCRGRKEGLNYILRMESRKVDGWILNAEKRDESEKFNRSLNLGCASCNASWRTSQCHVPNQSKRTSSASLSSANSKINFPSLYSCVFSNAFSAPPSSSCQRISSLPSGSSKGKDELTVFPPQHLVTLGTVNIPHSM